MDNNDLITTLAADLPGYSKRQRKLAQYICENCDRAAFMTADMLAGAAGVSESSVVRFARQLGYEGYSDMRKAMQQVIRGRLSVFESESAGGSMELLREALAEENDSVRSILCEQNEKCFEPAMRAMCDAGRVFIQGMGALTGLALHMSLRLKAMGLRVLCLQSYESGAEFLELGEGDVYVSVSSSLYSGRLSELRYARDMGAVTVLICDEELTAGSKLADHRLFARGDAALMALIRAMTRFIQRSTGLTVEDGMKKIEEKRREYLAYEYQES